MDAKNRWSGVDIGHENTHASHGKNAWEWMTLPHILQVFCSKLYISLGMLAQENNTNATKKWRYFHEFANDRTDSNTIPSWQVDIFQI